MNSSFAVPFAESEPRSRPKESPERPISPLERHQANRGGFLSFPRSAAHSTTFFDLNLRRRFEAMSGFDCAGCFKVGRLAK